MNICLKDSIDIPAAYTRLRNKLDFALDLLNNIWTSTSIDE